MSLQFACNVPAIGCLQLPAINYNCLQSPAFACIRLQNSVLREI